MKISHVHKMVNLLALLLMIGILGVAPPATAQQRICHRLVKVDTVADHDDQFSKDWVNNASVTRQSDGSIIVADTRLKGPTAWQIWLDKGKAIHTNRDPGGSAEVIWAIPPPIWCSDQNFTLGLTVTLTNGEAWAAANFGTNPVDPFQSGGTTAGVNPFGAIQAWGRSAPNMSGSITQRPKASELGDWTLWLYLRTSGSYNEFWIHYHYTHIPPGQEPPSQPTSTSPQPTSAVPQPTPAAPQLPIGGVPGTIFALPPFGSSEPYPNVSRMTLQAAQRRVAANDLVNIPIWLINGSNVANINFDLTFNASVARPEGTTAKGNLLDTALLSVNPNVSGIIRTGFAQTNGVTGTGTVMYVPFRAIGKVGDRTRLDLIVTTINNPSGAVLTIDRIPGEIVIVAPGEMMPGDCDGDGFLTALDAECALDISVGLRALILALDMDKNGDVTSRDAVMILQRILIR
jgi:hypothetical protein